MRILRLKGLFSKLVIDKNYFKVTPENKDPVTVLFQEIKRLHFKKADDVFRGFIVVESLNGLSWIIFGKDQNKKARKIYDYSHLFLNKRK